jgi:hypothetical protein
MTKRPAEHLIARFEPRMAGRDTLGEITAKGFSLVICCKACPRVVVWAPRDIEHRFRGKLSAKVADLAERLTCSGPEGCGHHEVALFPQYRDAD